jgi:hypothetical protein
MKGTEGRNHVLFDGHVRASVQRNTRAICKVHGLTLLLQVGTLRRCGDGLFSKVPPLASDALLTVLHPLLKNLLQTVDHYEMSCLRAPFHGWKHSEIAWGET